VNSTEKKDVNAIIYIINLDTAIERRKSIEEELLKTNIPFKFISAVDKNSIDTIKHQVVNKYKKPLIPAEIGCFLSHYKVKSLFLKSTYDFAIILEDDILLSEDFDKLIKKAVRQHSSLPKKHQWDVLKLKSHGRKRMIKINDIDENYSLISGAVAITTLAAIWTRKGAELFLENAVKNEACIIEMPIDCALQEPWKYNLKIFNISPPITSSKGFKSQIRPKKKVKSTFFDRISFEGKKVFPRAYHYVKTWVFR